VKLLLRWLVSVVAVFVAARIVPGIERPADDAQAVVFYAAIAVVLGLVNALIRPLLMVLTCPLQAITLGLFTLVVNAACFWLAGWIAQAVGIPFVVDGFAAALAGSLVVSVVSTLLNLFIRD
jgi:putative membrane protein